MAAAAAAAASAAVAAAVMWHQVGATRQTSHMFMYSLCSTQKRNKQAATAPSYTIATLTKDTLHRTRDNGVVGFRGPGSALGMGASAMATNPQRDAHCTVDPLNPAIVFALL